MHKVVVLGAGHRGSGKSVAISRMLEEMKGATMSVPCTGTVEPYSGPDERIEAVVTDLSFDTGHPSGSFTVLDIDLDDLRLEEFVTPDMQESDPPRQPVNWVVPGSHTMSIKIDGKQAELFEAFVAQIRAAELMRDIQRMGKVILVGSGPGAYPPSSHLVREDMMTVWDEKTVAKTKGRVHTTGRSRAARADRWR